jgi:hypothetical protein
MSSNISGFQGVKTPLQSMTNGQYTLADYTNLNRVLTARITALENATAFNPNNVTIGGFLNIQSNNTNPGNLSVTNNAQINGSAQINKSLTVNQNLNVAGNVVVAGNINFTSTTINTLNSTTINATTANTATINNSGTVTSAQFSGGGAGLTGVLDGTKLPTAGGTITGSLAVNGTTSMGDNLTFTNAAYGNRSINATMYNFLSSTNAQDLARIYVGGVSGAMTMFAEIYGAGTFAININGVGAFDVSNTTATFGVPLNVNAGIFGNGAGLTGIPYSALTGTVPTWNQSTTGNALTSTSTLNCPYTGLTGTVPTWNQSTTGNALTSTSTLNCPYTGLTGTVPTWNQNTTGSAASVPYSGLTGTVPTWNQNTTGTAAKATNIAGGSAGKIPYQSTTDTTLFTGVGVAGQILTSQASGAPIWANAPGGSPPTVIVLNGVNGSPTTYNHTNTALQVVYRLNQYGFTFYFNGGTIGQTIIFTRSAYDPSQIIFSYSGVPNLKYKVYSMNGAITNINTFGATFTATYSYASQQKIRSTFLVVAPSDVSYNFDLIEIA